MIFKHKKTGRDALWVRKEDIEGAILIQKPQDLPDIDWCKHFKMPPEIVKGQGKTGLLSYLKAFIEYPPVIYLWFIPSGFPEGKLPPELEQ